MSDVDKFLEQILNDLKTDPEGVLERFNAEMKILETTHPELLRGALCDQEVVDLHKEVKRSAEAQAELEAKIRAASYAT